MTEVSQYYFKFLHTFCRKTWRSLFRTWELILKCSTNKWCVKEWLILSWSGYGPVMNTYAHLIINFAFYKGQGVSWLKERVWAFRGRPCPMELHSSRRNTGLVSAVTTWNQVKMGQLAHAQNSTSSVMPSSAFTVLFCFLLCHGIYVSTFPKWDTA